MAKTATSTTRESATATSTTRESTTTSTTRESATTATSVSLGPLEDRVMRALWSTQAELSAREVRDQDRKSTRLNSSHVAISYAVFCLKKKRTRDQQHHHI